MMMENAAVLTSEVVPAYVVQGWLRGGRSMIRSIVAMSQTSEVAVIVWANIFWRLP